MCLKSDGAGIKQGRCFVGIKQCENMFYVITGLVIVGNCKSNLSNLFLLVLYEEICIIKYELRDLG